MAPLNRTAIRALHRLAQWKSPQLPRITPSGPMLVFGLVMETATFRLLAANGLINVINGELIVTDAGRAYLADEVA